MKHSIQCRNMVEQQIRTWEVLDDRVLDIYYEIPRDEFVPQDQAPFAYTDTQLPIGHNQVTLEPKVEARMLQELAPQSSEKILHIGTGSGFFAALLSRMCGKLVTVEIVPKLADLARERLASHRIGNVTVVTGDGLSMPIEQLGDNNGPFDAAVLTGSVPTVPESVLDLLTEQGRLLAPIGTTPVSHVTKLRRVGKTTTSEERFDTWMPELTHSLSPSAFDF